MTKIKNLFKPKPVNGFKASQIKFNIFEQSKTLSLEIYEQEKGTDYP